MTNTCLQFTICLSIKIFCRMMTLYCYRQEKKKKKEKKILREIRSISDITRQQAI